MTDALIIDACRGLAEVHAAGLYRADPDFYRAIRWPITFSAQCETESA